MPPHADMLQWEHLPFPKMTSDKFFNYFLFLLAFGLIIGGCVGAWG